MAVNRRRILLSGAALGAVACSGAQAKAFAASASRSSSLSEPLSISAVKIGDMHGLAVELAEVTLDLSAAGRAAGVEVPTTFDALADPQQLAAVRRVVAGVQEAGVQARYRLDSAQVRRLPLPQDAGRFASAGSQSVSFSRAARVAVFI